MTRSLLTRGATSYLLAAPARTSGDTDKQRPRTRRLGHVSTTFHLATPLSLCVERLQLGDLGSSCLQH